MSNPDLSDVPNLDGIFPAQLRQYLAQIAKRPGYDYVRAYCTHKIVAMDSRLSGYVNKALYHEGICDRIYADHLQGKVDW